MTGINGGSPDLSTFDALAEHVEQLYEVAAKRRNLLKDELAAADQELRRLERMLQIARPESRPAKQVAGPRNPRTRVSSQTLDKILAYMERHDPSPERGFRIIDIAEGVGVSQSSVSYGLQELRELERVRLVGKAMHNRNATGMQPSLYAVMPNG